MHVPVSEAEGQFVDLVRRAESGEEVVLTRDGRPALRLVSACGASSDAAGDATAPRNARLRTVFEQIEARNLADPLPPGPSAARSQDFLYDEDGLPA